MATQNLIAAASTGLQNFVEGTTFGFYKFTATNTSIPGFVPLVQLNTVPSATFLLISGGAWVVTGVTTQSNGTTELHTPVSVNLIVNDPTSARIAIARRQIFRTFF